MCYRLPLQVVAAEEFGLVRVPQLEAPPQLREVDQLFYKPMAVKQEAVGVHRKILQQAEAVDRAVPDPTVEVVE